MRVSSREREGERVGGGKEDESIKQRERESRGRERR